MRDTGDKIVHLAREILDNERTPDTQNFTGYNPRLITMRTACIAAMASAFGATGLTCIVSELHRPVSRYEQFEIDALVFYLAREKNVSQEQMRADIMNNLELKSIHNVNVYDYRRIRNYLWTRLQG